MFGLKSKILLSRLQSEVEYLRNQNQQLMDRLLALTDKTAYQQIKQDQQYDKAQDIEMAKVKRIHPDILAEKEKREAEGDRMQSIMLKQMFTGE